MSGGKTMAAAYFETLYAGNTDPWDFETSEYEHAKYAATIAALGPRRFGRTLEVGCSIGVLTRRLAGVTDDLIAIDISERALSAAERRNLDCSNVVFPNDLCLPTSPMGPSI